MRTERDTAAFQEEFVWKFSCYFCCVGDGCHEELTVIDSTIVGVGKNELLGVSTRTGIESSTYAPRVLAVEVYGVEYFPFW